MNTLLALALLASGLAAGSVLTAQVIRARERRARAFQAEKIGPVGTARLYASLEGSVIKHGDYRLASFDRGQTWWDVSAPSSVRPAHPALLEEVLRADELARLIRSDQRSGLRPISLETERRLRRHGFRQGPLPPGILPAPEP